MIKIRKSAEDYLEQILILREEKGFARSSNSYLVNLARVSAVDKNSLTVGGEELPISRTQKTEFMRALADFVGNS